MKGNERLLLLSLPSPDPTLQLLPHGRIFQRRIPLRGLEVLMTEQPSHRPDSDPLVEHLCGCGVPELVNFVVHDHPGIDLTNVTTALYVEPQQF